MPYNTGKQSTVKFQTHPPRRTEKELYQDMTVPKHLKKGLHMIPLFKKGMVDDCHEGWGLGGPGSLHTLFLIAFLLKR